MSCLLVLFSGMAVRPMANDNEAPAEVFHVHNVFRENGTEAQSWVAAFKNLRGAVRFMAASNTHYRLFFGDLFLYDARPASLYSQTERTANLTEEALRSISNEFGTFVWESVRKQEEPPCNSPS